MLFVMGVSEFTLWYVRGVDYNKCVTTVTRNLQITDKLMHAGCFVCYSEVSFLLSVIHNAYKYVHSDRLHDNTACILVLHDCLHDDTACMFIHTACIYWF